MLAIFRYSITTLGQIIKTKLFSSTSIRIWSQIIQLPWLLAIIMMFEK